MLAKCFDEQKASYEFLRLFSSKTEKLSNVDTRFVLESNEYIITINIEENECYASVTLERKKDKKVFYAFADYSFLQNSTDIFDVLGTINKDYYYQEIRKCLKQKFSKRNLKEVRMVTLIYSLLEAFILKIKG
ncbi:MAG: hypothetical protein GX109_03100 [Bacteroidales bacterium]|jgi:predicted transposase YdaD|nr:hypothetical protein [Bacteroidales bacterium]